MAERRMIFIPGYNCERQIPRVLAQFTPEIQSLFSEIVVIDNCSADNSAEVAGAALQKITGCSTALLRNNQNYGLGGSHKVALRYALKNNYDYCLVLHGDDQGNIRDILPELERGEHRRVECLLGARFMPGSRLQGYSWFRTAGNVVFNALFSLASRRVQWDLGSGLCCFSRTFMQKAIFEKCSDDLTFNYVLQLHSAAKGVTQKFFPISWREGDQISNVRLMRQTWQMIRILAHYVFRRADFLAVGRGNPAFDYTASVVAVNSAEQPALSSQRHN
jgi:glycosyltransferase involved in cell wall biosynthesis